MSEATEATLCFVFDDEEVLLIYKKRGTGEGLYNGPGGKVEDEESIKEAAVRETKEETHIEPIDPEKIGELDFYFGEEHFMNVHIFKTNEYKGGAQETEEARPEWFNTSEIPLDEMWPDDKYWVQMMLDGKQFEGEFFFDEDGDEIREYNLEEI